MLISIKATIFSGISFAALFFAAKMQGNQIILLNVLQTGEIPPDVLKQMPNPHVIQENRESVLKQAKDELESVAKKYSPEMNVDCEVITGIKVHIKDQA